MTNDTPKKTETPEERMKRVFLEKLMRPALEQMHESRKRYEQASRATEVVPPKPPR